MVELSMSVPRSDLLEFQRVMALLQTRAGKTPEKAVEMGAVFVAKALQAATVISPKQRKIIKTGTDIRMRDSVWDSPYEKKKWEKSGYSTWAVVEDPDRTKPRDIPIAGHYKTKQEAKATVEQKFLRIRQRGLARLLWWKAIAKVAVAQAGRHPDTGMGQDKIADRLLRVQMTKGDNASVTVTNSANYALKAFRSGGRATVDNAMRRAANNMRKYAERQTGEKFNEVGK
jgi:hypothetical protein